MNSAIAQPVIPPLSDGAAEAIKANLLSHIEVDSNGCWLWQRSRHRDGYGKIKLAGKDQYVHRVSYEIHVGPIPAGLCIDHLCRNRACCNPIHLECVTPIENFRRGISPAEVAARITHCPKGHPYDAINTYMHPRGKRVCIACRKIAQRRIKQGTPS